jgi:hypothetical protein
LPGIFAIEDSTTTGFKPLRLSAIETVSNTMGRQNKPKPSNGTPIQGAPARLTAKPGPSVATPIAAMRAKGMTMSSPRSAQSGQPGRRWSPFAVEVTMLCRKANK